MEKFYSIITGAVDGSKRPVNVVSLVLRRCLLVLWLVLAGQLARAQMYTITSNASNNFQRYDFGPNSFTALTDVTSTGGNAPALASVGNYVYAGQVNGTSVRRYDITANTWSTLPASANIINSTATMFFTDGISLYYKSVAQGTAAAIYQYDAVAASWSAVTAVGTTAFMTFSGVGVIYFTTSMSTSGKIRKYDPVTNTVSDVGNIPVALTALNTARSADAAYIYIVSSGQAFYKIKISDGSTTTGASAPSTFPNGMVSDGTTGSGTGSNLYAKTGVDVYKYTASTNSWTTSPLKSATGGAGSSPTAALAGSYYAPATPVCAAPVISASVTQATCTNSTVNSNGTITLTAFDANAKKIDYTIGSTYTGSGFASATTISGSAPYTVTSTLPNPTVNQPYTIRVFCDATNYTDKTVLLTPTKCQTADLSLAVSPATQTGNSGEFLTYTVTLTNAGPNTATNVGVSVPMPDPTATLLSATAATGSYSSTTKNWTVPSLAVGSTTLTFTVKVN